MPYDTVNLVGGAAFAVWGVIHVAVGALALGIFYTRGTESMLAFVDLDASVNQQSARVSTLLAEFYQALLLIGLTVTVLGVTLNLAGDPLGLIVNAVLVASVEAYFVWYEVLPGHRPKSVGVVTVGLMVAGIVFCGFGLETWIP